VLTTTTRWRRTLSYEIVPPADEDRNIVIEESRPDGWTLTSDAANVETTPTRYRYTVAAPKGKTTAASLTLERIENASVLLTTLAAEDILARVRGLQNESEAFKTTVARLSSIVNDINKAKAQRTQLDAERKKIAEDQARIRENLKSVGQGNDLGKRYIDSLKSQEDRLAAIAREDRDLEADIATKRKNAEDVARQINL
jgi:septal ring factor EnvC (AmiA/AmiB activator)